VLLRALLPFARHDSLAGVGHMGPITHAGEVNRRIVDFIMASQASGAGVAAARAA
jgi:hypothetical protein